MSSHIEKTVFVSYRRTNTPWALAIYKELTANGYDVFFDYKSIKNGDFEQVIIQNIVGRGHFVVILTPSALERCNEPGDWLRREIELALDKKRNIIPLFFDGFSFNSPSVSTHLTGKLELLKKYNGLTIPAEYFDAAMTRLREERLNVPLDAVLHPVSDSVQDEVERQKVFANKENDVNTSELVAQQWFEKGNKFFEEKNYEEAIYCYSESIQLKSDFAEVYNNRGFAWLSKKDYAQTIEDCTKSISLNPELPQPYSNRGVARLHKRDFDGAITDLTKSIELNKPAIYDAYYNRGLARYRKNDFSGAINDYTNAIHLKPSFTEAYSNRGIAYIEKGDLDDAIRDFSEIIRMNPNSVFGYNARGNAYVIKKDYKNGIRDFTEAIRLDPLNSYAYGMRGRVRMLNGDLLNGGLDIAKSKAMGSSGNMS